MDIGKFYRGEVESVNDDGSVTVQWADGSTSVLPPKKAPKREDVWPVPGDRRCNDKLCLCNRVTEETK